MTFTLDSTMRDLHGAAPKVTILVDRCAGCQECVVRCPTAALSMDTGNWVAKADQSLCVGCRQCVRTCPFSAIEVEGAMMVGPRAETSYRHPTNLLGDAGEIREGILTLEAAVAEASRCLECPDPTCVRGCPVHNDIPGFLHALREEDLDQAQQVLRRTSVLPDICSRVCDQAVQCEGSCSWSLAGGQPVAIGALERFIADNSEIPPAERVSEAAEGLEVAVVGSGPAGIGAAWELVQAGAKVTVYEKQDQPGGLLRWGIPDFTLPSEVAMRPWDQLMEAGVELRCGEEVHPDRLSELLEHNDAVVLAQGAGVPMRPPVPGTDLDGVMDATQFLTRSYAALERHQGMDELRVAAGSKVRPPKVLVLGGGNTAMDVARSARRLGASAMCVDWMDRRFAPVRPDELTEAEAEGVVVKFSTTLAALEGEQGRVAYAKLSHTRQESAKEKPEVIEGSIETEPVDLVVMAMGYRNDPEFSPVLPGTPIRKEVKPLPDRQWTASGLLANPAPDFARHMPVGKLALGRDGALSKAALPFGDRCWAAGDALVGPSTVVEAMAQGRRAGHAIIARHPQRPARTAEPQPPSSTRRVLIAYESRSGNTKAVAGRLQEALNPISAEVTCLPLNRVGAAELAEADLLVLGTWVEGFVVARVGPAKATKAWLAQLPRMAGVEVALFCTYRVDPKGTLAAMRKPLEAKGARVVAEAAFGRRDVEITLAELLGRLVRQPGTGGVKVARRS